MEENDRREGGFTIVELVISLTIFAIVALSSLSLLTALINSTTVAKRIAVASTLATNQMEYIKSLPYDSLAITGGDIYAPVTLPSTTERTLNGVKYTIRTGIRYVDDAFDGCANYASPAIKDKYCVNQPVPTSVTTADGSPQDYKVVNVKVYDKNNAKLAEVDTQIAARVSETNSTTGALFVTVIDSGGNPVEGANVNLFSSTPEPDVNLNIQTDSFGLAVFFGLPPSPTNSNPAIAFDYKATATKTGYSSLTTIVPTSTLTPTYSNQRVLAQQSSYLTMPIKLQGSDSLVIEAVNAAGAPLTGAKIYVKGGYKRYTSTADTTYYYETTTSPDARLVTDATGQINISNLVPGNYIFCGDAGATSCVTNTNTALYLAAAIPYGGTTAFNPIAVPIYDPSNPPTTTFTYGSTEYLQKVRLILVSQSNFPRINTVTPYEVSKSSGASSFSFVIKGTNLPCSNNAASCSTTVRIVRSPTTYNASCTGSSAGTQLTCTINLSAASIGIGQLIIIANGNTLTLPASMINGGINVTP